MLSGRSDPDIRSPRNRRNNPMPKSTRLTGDSSIGTWLDDPIGGPIMTELLAQAGQDASVMKPVRRLALKRLVKLSQGAFTAEMIADLEQRAAAAAASHAGRRAPPPATTLTPRTTSRPPRPRSGSRSRPKAASAARPSSSPAPVPASGAPPHPVSPAKAAASSRSTSRRSASTLSSPSFRMPRSFPSPVTSPTMPRSPRSSPPPATGSTDWPTSPGSWTT